MGGYLSTNLYMRSRCELKIKGHAASRASSINGHEARTKRTCEFVLMTREDAQDRFTS